MLDQELEILKKLKDYRIQIGVVSEDSSRKETISIGITNAELMAIHENGSPLNNIPARPVLNLTINWVESKLLPKTLDKIIDNVVFNNWNINDIETELKKLCIRMENHARQIIYDNNGVLAPNSPKVAARKKGNHPLFDTGQLARSITCNLIKV